MNRPTHYDAIQSLVPNAEAGVTTKGDQVIIHWEDEREQPSEEAISAKLVELLSEYPIQLLREERNRKLAETDWRASSDLTLGEWATYRQALRDLPSTATPTLDDDGNLQNVTWPSEPT